MNKNFLLLPCLILLLAGCRSMTTLDFTAYGPEQSPQLVSASRTVVDVICTNVTEESDYNLWENMQMLAPITKYGKLDITMQVKRVIKGKCNEPTLRFYWLRCPTGEQAKTLGFTPPKPAESTNSSRPDYSWPPFPYCPITNGMPLRIGFDDHAGRYFQHLKILVQHN